MEKNFFLPKEIIALSGVASKNESRAMMGAVHFDGKNAMVTDGHRLALIPFYDPDMKGTSLNLSELSKPKGLTSFVKAGENRFLSSLGAADVVEGTPPDYKAVIPTVSPESHQAIAINVDYLLGLYKAIDSDNKGGKKGILTLLISKQSNLDGIGVVSSNSGGIGVLMPCRPFGGAGFPDAFQKFAAISGQNSLEGQIKAVEELTKKVEAGEVELSSDVAAVFKPKEEAAPVDEAEEMEEETEGGEIPAEEEAEAVEEQAAVA